MVFQLLRALLLILWLIPSHLFAQEQIITNELSLGELRADQSLQLTIIYNSTNSEKTAGLGLRLHFDSSAIELGDVTERLTEAALPFQIKNDSSNLDNNNDTDKYFLTAWADTSGQGWPYNANLPVTLYSLPMTAKSEFNNTTLQFSGYTAVGYSLNAGSIDVPLAIKPIISLVGQSEVSLELGTSYTDAGATATDNIDGDITDSIEIVNNVDINTVGTYSVTYNVRDAAGNSADEVSRVVNITPDVTKPIISLVGQSEVSLELGTTYTDAGATATDNIDGDITDSIEIVNSVDINTVGTYSVTYNVRDAAGNAADEVTRVVNITPDVTKPVISLVGQSEVSLELGTSYTDAGATAVDNADGDITDSIEIVNSVDINTVGTYSVTYNVRDAAGNSADEVTRVVNITPDVTKPIITLIGDSNVQHELGTAYTDAGATAVDNIDGDITGSIEIVNNVDINTVGTYSVTYNVRDAAGNSADEVTRVVNITPDVTKPIISLVGQSEVSLELGTSYTDAGATATDNIDGDITDSIEIVNSVDINTVGTYSVTYNVRDAAGNSADEVSRVVNITPDVTKPIISLVGQSEVSLELGTTYTDAGATATDNIDGDITDSIEIVNSVDINTVGTYSVTYNVRDAAGNSADEVTRVVNITPDVTKPIISLVGQSEVSLELGTSYTDAGATAVDNIDGDITGSIEIVNNVDINTVGTYLVTYNVRDAAGNAADEVTRIVNITPDVTKPIITLIGDSNVQHELGTAYTDAGATATDNIDGDITSSMISVSDVNADIAGSYTVTYSVVDNAGNESEQKVRSVTVSDTTIPVIEIIGDSEIQHEQGTSYADAGATAVDNIDGDITNSIISVSDVNADIAGSYTVTYSVVDNAGNEAEQKVRSVTVSDTTIPVIKIIGDSELSLELGTSYTDAGATAVDNADGDITGSIEIVNNVDINTVGTYLVTYNVRDAAGNAADEVTRIVNITPDVTKPIITLIGDSNVQHELGTAYTDAGATATDNIDGDITSSMISVSDVNADIAGSYTVTYSVVDNAGNESEQKVRSVTVSDTTIPVIEIIGDSEIQHEQGTSYADAGATAVDNIDGDITNSIISVSDVNGDVAGSYTVTYSVVDNAGNEAEQKVRSVTVSDTTIPVIKIIGDSEIQHEQGTSYTDAGATAVDNIDGDITSSIISVSDVNSDVAGSYTVTYSVVDNAGNEAEQKVRSVTVSDTTIPVIELIGESEIDHEYGLSYVDMGATATDNVDGDISHLITITNTIDINIVGTYIIFYNVSDSSSNAATEIQRKVTVGIDYDGDGLAGPQDNCPDQYNPSQNDFDGDNIGDACDDDDDNDGVADGEDAFPFDATESIDTDGDGIGNNQDNDDDNDGYFEVLGGVYSGDYQGVYLDSDGQVLYKEFYNTSGYGLSSDGSYIYGCPDQSNGEEHILRFDNTTNQRIRLFEGLCSDILVTSDSIFYLNDNFVGRYIIESNNNQYPYFEYQSPSDSLGLGHDGDNLYIFGSQITYVVSDENSSNYGIDVSGGHQSTVTEDYFILTGDSLRLVNRLDPNFTEFVIDNRAPLATASDGRYAYATFNATSSILRYDIGTGEFSTLSGGTSDIRGLTSDGNGLWMTNRAVRMIPSVSDICSRGIDNPCDQFPLDSTEWLDSDQDGIGDNGDNCPEVSNEDQSNFDNDSLGDICDPDDDNDGYSDDEDTFPLDPTEAVDTDSDGIGNNADTDDDNDGYLDNEDAFPLDVNEWIDTDSDGIGNNADTDDDGDGYSDDEDIFPLDSTEWFDSDQDGVGDNSDVFPNDPNEQVDSDQDGVGDNSDAFPNNPAYFLDSDQDGMPDAWEIQFGLDPNDPSDANSDFDNDGVSALEEFIAGTIPGGTLDVDGNQSYDALTDGLLILRYMFGLTDNSLITGAVASDAIYKDADSLQNRLAVIASMSDIDGSGSVDALTDGLLILRYLFGLEGDTLIIGVLSADATRTESSEIEDFLSRLTP